MVGTTYFKHLSKLLQTTANDERLFELIVNAPFHDRIVSTELDLGIVVLLLVDKAAGTINRIALSNTELAAGAVKMSEMPFSSIKIPVDHETNAIAEAIRTNTPQSVTDWKYLFVPALGPRAARFNQAGSGIEYSCIYPLQARDGGALIFSYYQESKNVAYGHVRFMQAYAELVDDVLAGQR